MMSATSARTPISARYSTHLGPDDLLESVVVADGHPILGTVQADRRPHLERAPDAAGKDERTGAVTRSCRCRAALVVRVPTRASKACSRSTRPSCIAVTRLPPGELRKTVARGMRSARTSHTRAVAQDRSGHRGRSTSGHRPPSCRGIAAQLPRPAGQSAVRRRQLPRPTRAAPARAKPVQ